MVEYVRSCDELGCMDKMEGLHQFTYSRQSLAPESIGNGLIFLTINMELMLKI